MENFQPLHVGTADFNINFDLENMSENPGETTEEQNEMAPKEVINVEVESGASNKKSLHPVWEYFVVTKTEIKCQIKSCKATLSLPQSTTNAKRHLERFHKISKYIRFEL
jgi:hypothetical protein